MRKLAIGAKYAMAHKGVLLAREKAHLASLGIAGEKYVELNFLCGFISAHNQNYSASDALDPSTSGPLPATLRCLLLLRPPDRYRSLRSPPDQRGLGARRVPTAGGTLQGHRV